MSQQTSPFIEGKYGWNLGESGWNSGMDENLLKFSFLFDRNVDGIVSTLPLPPTNGNAYFLTTDNRFYFVAGGVYYSSPVPKGFQFLIRSTNDLYQFNGTTAVQVDNSSQTDARLDAVELTLSTLGTAAFQPATAFVKTADLASTTDVTKGAALANWLFNATGASAISQAVKNSQRVSVASFGVTGVGDDSAAMIAAINWQLSQRITFNPTIGASVGSAIVNCPVLTIPNNWTVKVQGNLPVWCVLVSEGRSTIQSLDDTKDIMKGADSYYVYTADITFLGGKSQLVKQNNNINAGMWIHERVWFEGSNDYASQDLNTSGSYPVTSTQPIYNECRWIRCKRGLKHQADHAYIVGGWMQPEGDFFDADTAFIHNAGLLSMNMVMGIPGGTFPAKSRWVDNYGALRCMQTRFGGEGGGLPCVYHFAAPTRYLTGDAKNIEMGISFDQCTLYGGNGARADQGIIVLQGQLPPVVRITDCTGPITAPYIKNDPANGGIADITAYIAALKASWSGDDMFLELGYHYNGNKIKFNGTPPLWPAALDIYTYFNGRRYVPRRVKLQNTVAQTNLTSGGTVRLTTPTVISDPYSMAGLTSGDTVVKVPSGVTWARVHGYIELNSHAANDLLYLLRIYYNNLPVVDGTARYAHSATGVPGWHTYAEFQVAAGADIDLRLNQTSGSTLTANVTDITVTFE